MCQLSLNGSAPRRPNGVRATSDPRSPFCHEPHPITVSRLPTAASAVLCVIAAAAHLYVFSRAVACAVGNGQGHLGFSLDCAVTIAYLWDVGCLCVGVIPFSRVRRPREMLAHHVPVFIFLALALPYYCGWGALDAAAAVVRDDDLATKRVLEIINAWGFLSSLNEAIMSVQRAQILILGPKSVAAFLSPPAITLELLYKLAVFTAMPLVSVRACFEFDVIFWRFVVDRYDAPLRTFFASPLFVRTFIWRLFVVTQYPSMANRTWLKLARHLRGGGGDDTAAAAAK